nr:hypothetical protein [Streptomyces catenulae]
MVADELLVEGGLGAAGLPEVGGPEARRVGRQDLVGQDQFAVLEAELELGVGEEDAATAGDVAGAGVDVEGGAAQPGGGLRADLTGDLLVRDVLVVVADGRLGGRGEDRGGEFGAVDEALGERQTADRAGLPVLGEAGAGEVAAGDALDGGHVQGGADEGAARPVGGGAGGQLRGEDVVGDEVGELVEPPQGELGEDAALVGDLGGQHPVVHGDAVTGDHDQFAVGVLVEVTHLAGVKVGEAGHLQGLGLFYKTGHAASA